MYESPAAFTTLAFPWMTVFLELFSIEVDVVLVRGGMVQRLKLQLSMFHVY